MKVRIWGARGSIPSPLKPEEIKAKICQVIHELPDQLDTNDLDAVEAHINGLPPLVHGTAGGNTTCVQIIAGEEIFIIDAGSGIRELGLELMKGPCGRGEGRIHIFFSHAHWDHIQGFPFFTPAFIPGNKIFIYGLHDMETALNDQQRPLNFPIALSFMQAEFTFVTLDVGQPFSVGPFQINTIENGHPGKSYSYRFEDQHSTFVHASDSEYKSLDDEDIQPHLAFFKDADALIFDAQYTLKEAWHKVDWGHSSAMIGVDFARTSGVKRLVLFHHDPTYSDMQLQEIQSTAIAYQAQNTSSQTCEVIVAYEGLTIDLTPAGTVDLQLSPDGNAAILTPTSVFDEQGITQLTEQLIHLKDQDGPAGSVIDLSQVETLTTASLKSLIALYQEQKGDQIVLANPSERVLQVLKLGGYLDYFALYPSVEAGLAAIQARKALNLPGQIIANRYQIEQKLGDGHLGVTLKATDVDRNQAVTLKILSSAFHEEAILRLFNQQERLTGLDHANIVPIIDLNQVNNHTFMVEDFIAGQTLHALLKAGASISNTQAIDLALDITLALEYSHNRGVIHGNLNPRNIAITTEGARIKGFGLGRLEDRRNLLEMPSVFLDVAYLAPEQILGQIIDARTDLYALGVVMYRLFTGRFPFEGLDQAVMRGHLYDPPPPPRELNPEISPSLEHLILKLLAKSPNERYTNAGQAHRIISSLVTGATELKSQYTKVLVGRENDVSTLEALWNEALTSKGQLVFITGEAGIGKTSLMQTVIAKCAPPVALTGYCQDLEGSPAYHPIAEILQAYFVTASPEFFDTENRQLIANFASLVPQVHQVIPDLVPPPPLEPKLEQLRLMTSLTQFIKKATHERPWLIVLENLQWVDMSSLELLRYLGHHLPTMALMVVGIYRDVELGHSPALKEALRDLNSQPTYKQIALSRLSLEGTKQLLSNIWPHSVLTAFAKSIYQHTDGNPFYIEEVTQGLVDHGLINQQDGVWQFPVLDAIALPEGITEAVLRRIRHLDVDTQSVLRQAAVLGQTFKLEHLLAISDLSEWEILEQLDLALERQLIQEVPNKTLFRFRSAEIQSVLYDDLSALRRRLLHRRAGEALEKRALANARRIPEQMAHHFAEAGEYLRAITYGIEAADQAKGAYANASALMWYKQSLDLIKQLNSKQALSLYELQVVAHENLAEVLVLIGQYDDALANYSLVHSMVKADLPSPAQKQHLARLNLLTADVFRKRGEYDDAFNWLKQGLDYLDTAQSTLEAAQLYLHSAVLYLRQRKDIDAQTWCEKALNIALQSNSQESQQIVGRAYYILANIHSQQGNFNKGIEYCQKSVELYQQSDDVVGLSIAYLNLGIVFYEQGDWVQSRNAYHRSLAIKKDIGDIYGQGQVSNNLGNIYMDSGEWAEATKLFQKSHNIWQEIGAAGELANTNSNLAQVYIYQQNWNEARRCLELSQAGFIETGSDEFMPELVRRWGELYLETGELNQALDHTLKSVELAITQGALLDLGLSRRLLGKIYLALGKLDQANAELRWSLQILADLDSEYEIAKTKLTLAALIMQRDSPTEAHIHLSQCIKTFEKLGAQDALAEAIGLKQQQAKQILAV